MSYNLAILYVVMNRLKVSLLIFAGLWQHCYAQDISQSSPAKPILHWLEPDYPPAFFVRKGVSHQGFAQKAKQNFIVSLANYQHVTLTVNNNRLKKYLTDKRGIYCIAQAGISRNEIPFVQYSNVANIVPAAGIVVRDEDKDLFIETYGTSFANMIKDTRLKIGNVSEGFYGASINQLLQSYRQRDHVITRHSSTNSSAFYKMLGHKRLDYFLDYAFSYQFNKAQAQQYSLSFLALREQSVAKKAYAVCNDSPFSKSIIERINKVMSSDQYRRQQLQGVLEYTPDSLKDTFSILSQQIGR